MAVIRWQPNSNLFDLRRDMNRLFEGFWGDDENPLPMTQWAPATDLVEKEDEFVLTAELPGMTQKDISVTITNNVVTIKGEKKQESENKEGSVHRTERTYGGFSRSFTLPAGARTEKVDASYRDGVLSLRIPKAEEAKPKQIEVKVN